MSRLISNSAQMAGIIEDIDTSRLRHAAFNLRSVNESIDELANSIQQKGLLQPILVRPHEEGYYEIVAGNRRYVSCKILGWKKIPCHIMELDDKEAFEISLVENIQRKSLSPLDEARSFKAYVIDFGWGGASDLASRLGKSASYITKKIHLLDLPSDVMEHIDKNEISPSIAEELCLLKDKSKQSAFANMITKRHLSLRRTRELIKNPTLQETYLTYQKSDNEIRIAKASRRIDKSITAIRFAMNTIGIIVEDSGDDLIIHKILMDHKHMLHSQIDMLIKEKKRICRRGL